MSSHSAATSLQIGAAFIAFALASCGGGSSGSGFSPNLNVKPASAVFFPGARSPSFLYVANYGQKLTIYPTTANEDTAPVRVIAGQKTLLVGPEAVAVDSQGNTYVSNGENGACQTCITVYAPHARGNVAPIRFICGPRTEITFPVGLAFDSADNLYVANGLNDVLVFAAGASGDVAPIRVIKGPLTQLIQPEGIALDTSGKIYVTNGYTYQNGNLILSKIAVYRARSSGNVAPIATIQGGQTQLGFPPEQITLDSAGNIYVAVADSGVQPINGYILMFGGGSNGNVAPARMIRGFATGLIEPDGIALDRKGNIYVSDFYAQTIAVFAPGANGDVAPIRTITGNSTGLVDPSMITIHEKVRKHMRDAVKH